MSIIICADCNRHIDTDKEPVYEIHPADNLYQPNDLLCEDCEMTRLEAIEEAEAYGPKPEDSPSWGLLFIVFGIGFAICIIANLIAETGKLL